MEKGRTAVNPRQKNGDEQFCKYKFHAANGMAQYALVFFLLSFGLGGGGEGKIFFSFFVCSQHVPFKFPMGSHQVHNNFPRFPIAPQFNPICFAQSPPLAHCKKKVALTRHPQLINMKQNMYHQYKSSKSPKFLEVGQTGPSPIACLSLNTYLYFHHMCLLQFELFKMLWECIRCEKEIRRKISFPTYKMRFFFSFFASL